MSQTEKPGRNFVGYEYKIISIKTDKVSMYLDCYKSFGWIADENAPFISKLNNTTVKLKRDRKIINKTELTRLQRHFEACANEIELLEKSKTSTAAAWSLSAGILGTAFIAGSTFAVTHEPPIIWLCIILAIPGFIGWILPYFINRRVAENQAQKLQPLIEAKYEEVYEICEKGYSLL